jgi:amicyanin
LPKLSFAGALAASVVIAATPAAGQAPSAPAAATVSISNFTFSPQTLKVRAGTTVTWVNQDDTPHQVMAVNKGFRSKAMDTDDRFSFTFAKPGAYDYFCAIHPHMTGKVVVAPS